MSFIYYRDILVLEDDHICSLFGKVGAKLLSLKRKESSSDNFPQFLSLPLRVYVASYQALVCIAIASLKARSSYKLSIVNWT